MHLIARYIPYYGKRRLKPGDEFEASDKHGELLVKIGAASAMVVPTDTREEEPPKRRYRRRDLQAEE